jgi:predicted dehydrogenase
MIRVALIGYGYAGRVFHAPLISATPGLELTVIGSRQKDLIASAYAEVQVVADPLEAIRHPEVALVVIATPNDSHAFLVDAALGAGKHVVVDKPFTITLAEARALAAKSTAVNRALSVFQNRRWDSDFLAIAQEAAGGRIGEVVEFRSEMSRFRPVVRDRWRERPGPGSGLWYDLGSHLVDQALVLFGPPETVQADLQIQRNGGSTTDWFHAILGYGPKRAILVSSMMASHPSTRFIVRGTRASLVKGRWDPQEEQLVRGEQPGASGWGQDPDPLLLFTDPVQLPVEIPAPAGNYLAYYSLLRDAILGESELPVTPPQATTVMAVLEAGIRSSEEGRAVRPLYNESERSAWELR